MMRSPLTHGRGAGPVLLLGTDDVASAVGHYLYTAGHAVTMVRDRTCPVLRRAMSFDDALETGAVWLDGVLGYAARAGEAAVEGIAIREDAPEDLLRLARYIAVVDARLRRRAPTIDLRPYTDLAVGLGPDFDAGRNVHVAIETAPEATGQVIWSGPTLAAHGRSAVLGGAGRERFGRAPGDGVWRSCQEIGAMVSAGEWIGFCGVEPLTAPLSGRLRGVVRDGTQVTRGMRLLEVDPRGMSAACSGIPARAAEIARAVWTVVDRFHSAAARKTA